MGIYGKYLLQGRTELISSFEQLFDSVYEDPWAVV